MRFRDLRFLGLLFFTISVLSSCMRTDYVGSWKGEYMNTEMIYHMKTESYTLESRNLTDTNDKFLMKGVILINADTLTFVQSMHYDYAQNVWVGENHLNKGAKAVYKVEGDKLTLGFNEDVLHFDRVKK